MKPIAAKQGLDRSCARGPEYVNLIAIRTADEDKPRVRILVDSYHTPEVEEFVLDQVQGRGAAELVGSLPNQGTSTGEPNEQRLRTEPCAKPACVERR
ncbi:MetQ/NlpA family ABC transporter substrate-binding protein [Bradyrhizobium betae]